MKTWCEDRLQDGWDEDDLGDAILAVRDRTLFGEDGGKAIMGILE